TFGTISSGSGIGEWIQNSGLGLAFHTSSLARMNITNSGFVGIGVTSPSDRLAVGNGTTEVMNISGTSGSINFLNDQATLTFPASNGTPAPMINIFSTGTSNTTKMVIQHSPAWPTYGLQYED